MRYIKFILVLTLIFSSVSINQAFSEETDPNDLGAYYVINDDFSMPQPNTYSPVKPSGWDVDQLGGSISAQGSKGLGVMDVSEILPVTLNKKFNVQNSKLTWEYIIVFNTSMVGTTVSIGYGKDAAITVLYKADGVFANGTRISAYTPGEVVGFKSEIDIPNNKYSIWLNGKKIINNASFASNVSKLDNINIVTGKESQGNLSIYTVRLYRGYIINERSIYSPYGLSDEWTINSGKDSLTTEKLLGGLYPDVYSIKFNDSDFLNPVKISRKFDYSSEELSIEYQFLAPETVAQFMMDIGMGDDNLISIGFKKNQFGYITDSKTFQPIYNLKNNLWYRVQLDLKKDGAVIWLNGKKLVKDMPLKYLKIDNIAFSTSSAMTGIVWLDDVYVKETYEKPADYVPAPIIPDRTGYIVGMQSCSMWKDGSHFGWDWLNPYKDRHSYLGFYDDCTPEVKDWELKWMLENGIDYEMYCWFRPPEGNNLPIKYPRNSYSLHEGFFTSEYSDLTKFAIAWENGGVGVSGSEDFRKNVVPFWMEYYVKDPRYLVVDNKPVICIYSLSGLKSAFGSAENIKAEMDYVRNACVEAGFAGATMLITTSATTTAAQKELSDCGFDCVYNYSWGMSAGIVETQMSNLEAKRDAAGVDMMITLAMGRDDTPWERSAGTWASVEDFGRLLDWGKDTFIPSLPSDSLGKRFVMFGNWNEYGEGHILSPINLHGFGYLSEIRRVFTKNNGEADTSRPTSHQLERINRLYVQDRELEMPYAVQKSASDKIPETVKWSYEFNDGSEGWTVAKQVEDFKFQNGIMSGTSVDADPGMFSPADINQVIGDVTHIRVKMKADIPAGVVMYFITEDSTNWQEAKALRANYDKNGDEFTDVIFETGLVTTWSGKLMQVRLDPLTSTGKFEIDSVEFLSSKEEGALTFSFEDEERFFTRPLIMENSTFMVPAAEMDSYFGTRWAKSIDGSLLRIYIDEKIYELPFGVDELRFDGGVTAIPQGAILFEGQAYYPLRAVAEKLGYKVVWDGERNGVNIIPPEEEGSNDNIVYPPDKEGEFNFHIKNDFQGFSPNSGIANLKASNSILSFQSTSVDPNFMKGVNWNAADFPKLYIRVKNQTPDSRFQVYFTTNKDNAWNEAKSVIITTETNSSEFIEYSTAMNANWKDTITGIRVDPANGAGSYEIDYIIFAKEMVSTQSNNGVNLVANGNMDNSSFNYTAKGVKASYSTDRAYNGRSSLKLINEAEGGFIYTPVSLKQDMVYKYELYIYANEACNLEVGTVNKDGIKTKIQDFKVSEVGSWKQISGSYTQGISDPEAGFYISADGKTYYIDSFSFRSMS